MTKKANVKHAEKTSSNHKHTVPWQADFYTHIYSNAVQLELEHDEAIP